MDNSTADLFSSIFDDLDTAANVGVSPSVRRLFVVRAMNNIAVAYTAVASEYCASPHKQDIDKAHQHTLEWLSSQSQRAFKLHDELDALPPAAKIVAHNVWEIITGALHQHGCVVVSNNNGIVVVRAGNGVEWDFTHPQPRRQ